MSKKQIRRRSTKPLEQIKIAKQRIAILHEEAKTTADPVLQKRYIQLAKKIGMRYNVRLPRAAKRSFCKYCFAALKYGWRTKNSIRYTKCQSCGKAARFPFRK